MARLQEVDKISIQVLVDNELDPISKSTNPLVTDATSFRLVPLPPGSRGPVPAMELRMDQICCGAHGLSLLITTTAGAQSRTLLFDAGPEEDVFEKNVSRSGADLSDVEHVHLSHWHRDHSGGLPRAISLVNRARSTSSNGLGLPVVDVHPGRPIFRGVDTGTFVASLEADPTFDELETAGGTVVKRNEPHAVLDDMFLISGEVPRTTEYEVGFPRGVRLNEDGVWIKDELILDERFVVCNLKGMCILFLAQPQNTPYIHALIRLHRKGASRFRRM